jgi:trimeric autotransporter adhesin
MRSVCAFVVFSALTFSQMAWGQAFQGSLRGRVTDPKDAVVPLAKVTVVEEAANVSNSTVTNDQGQYSFPALNPSTYTLVIEAPGFKKLEQKGIVIQTQTANTQDAKLDIGQVTETINVTAEAELLDTSEASTGTVIDRSKMEELPILGRDPFLYTRLS